ncbi:MAG: Lrp/AsnC family transcriptional regulator [Spirochaetota bacterium]
MTVMTSFNPVDLSLLEEVQKDFPLVSRPYRSIGSRCSLSENDTIEKIRNFTTEHIIREISAIFNASKLGFKTSLIALAVNEKSIEGITGRINAHPGVSHNYLRNHRYNIWFTLSLPVEKDFKEELEKIDCENRVGSFLILPALKTFKLGVNFRLSEKTNRRKADRQPLFSSPVTVSAGSGDFTFLTDFDKRLVRRLEEPLLTVPRPWGKIAETLKLSETELFDEIRRLKRDGIVRRISAVLRHRNIGFTANGMTCFRVPEIDIIGAGTTIAEYEQVSHCYQRPTYPGWQYPLFAMVHERDSERLKVVVKEIAGRIQCDDYQILFSSKEFKKERVKYF